MFALILPVYPHGKGERSCKTQYRPLENTVKKIFYKKVKKVMIFFICLIETGMSL